MNVPPRSIEKYTFRGLTIFCRLVCGSRSYAVPELPEQRALSLLQYFPKHPACVVDRSWFAAPIQWSPAPRACRPQPDAHTIQAVCTLLLWAAAAAHNIWGWMTATLKYACLVRRLSCNHTAVLHAPTLQCCWHVSSQSLSGADHLMYNAQAVPETSDSSSALSPHQFVHRTRSAHAKQPGPLKWACS